MSEWSMETFGEYYKAAMRTANPMVGWEHELVVTALGLCGEGGEFADHVKKFAAQGHVLDREKLIKELGDCLWYIALGTRALGITMQELATRNIQKLAVRYPDGFDPARSTTRAPGDT